MTHPLDLSIPDIATHVERGDVSAVSLAEEALSRIEAGRDLNAFIHVARDRALEAARIVDSKRKRG
jgi:Asp-tRNA(Asn)/Glu-tRNA(Gln) amidotransferase A subunit family amidase